jgi:hypothetical protein
LKGYPREWLQEPCVLQALRCFPDNEPEYCLITHQTKRAYRAFIVARRAAMQRGNTEMDALIDLLLLLSPAAIGLACIGAASIVPMFRKRRR